MAPGEDTITARSAASTSTKFYSAWFCPYAHRVWIALEFKKVAYTWIECVLYERDPSTKIALPLEEKRRRTPGFVECCPRGLVPGIETADGTTMYESLVLLEYVDEAFDGPKLLPAAPAERARVKLWVSYVAERVLPCYYRMLMAKTDLEAREKARQGLLDGLRVLSTEALVHPKGPFLCGDCFGLFEAALLPWWGRMHSVLAAYRDWATPPAAAEPSLNALHAWGAACAAHPAYAATLVDRERLVRNNIGYADNTATSTCAQISRGEIVKEDGTAAAPKAAAAAAAKAAGNGASSGGGGGGGGGAEGVEGVLFHRLSSNNSARVRLWLYQRGLEGRYELRQLTHQQLSSDEEFLAASPHGKVPALRLATGECLGEAAVIVSYLEHRHAEHAAVAAAPLLPAAPAARAHMQLLIQSHDLYLASPNASERHGGLNCHNMGCLFLPPAAPGSPAKRQLDAPTRAAKLAEVWRQLDLLESLFAAPYAAGGALSLADLALFPTFVYFDFYLPKVFGSDCWHGRPKLQAWFGKLKAEEPAVRRVLAEMEPALLAKAASGDLEAIVAQTQAAESEGLKWRYP